MAVRSATLQPMQLLVHGGDDNDDDEEDGNRHQHHHGHKRVISITMAMMMVLLLIYLFCKQDHDLIHRSSLLPPLSPINKMIIKLWSESPSSFTMAIAVYAAWSGCVSGLGLFSLFKCRV